MKRALSVLLVLLLFFMLCRVARRAEKPALLVVEEYKRRALELILGHFSHSFQKGDHPGGIIVGGVLICGSRKEKQKDRKEANVSDQSRKWLYDLGIRIEDR